MTRPREQSFREEIARVEAHLARQFGFAVEPGRPSALRSPAERLHAGRHDAKEVCQHGRNPTDVPGAPLVFRVSVP